ncbi:hypothetical protein [Shewanella sp. Scap07]|uniref:hypothetical protein n=1 Tax=Shewanella sp. Scap07 TaxID=2589987 RepID=UPI001C4DC4D3|nr:hypothetical protein [Shewanella sp. Scap07]
MSVKWQLTPYCCLAGLLVMSAKAVASDIPGMAPAAPWDLSGYIHYSVSSNNPNGTSSLVDHLLHQRFNFEYRFDSDLRLNVGMRNRLHYGDSPEIPGFAQVIEADSGYMDLSHNWLDSGSWLGNSQFDRLNLSWDMNQDWQLKLGRFRVNWAMSTLWNPNDIFNAYSIYDVDYAERRGSDAVQLSRQLGFASSIDAVYSINDDDGLDRNLDSYALRYLTNANGWDLQVLAGKSLTDYVLGAGFAGDIAGAGLRAEWSYFDPVDETWPVASHLNHSNNNKPSSPSSLATDIANQSLPSSHVATIEADYSFASQRNYLVRTSLLYISNPIDADSALAYLNLPLNARTLSFANWTYYVDVSADISDLSRLTLSSSYYDDGSYFVGASQSYSLSDDWQVQFILQRFDGSGASLFGQTPSTLSYLQFNWSF